MSKRFLWILLSLFWLYHTLGSIFMGGIFYVFKEVLQGEGRQLMCGSDGCTDMEYFLSIIWLIGQLLLIFIPPIVLIYYLVRRRNRRDGA